MCVTKERKIITHLSNFTHNVRYTTLTDKFFYRANYNFINCKTKYFIKLHFKKKEYLFIVYFKISNN